MRSRSAPWFGARRTLPPVPPPMRLPTFREERQPVPEEFRREAAARGYILPESWTALVPDGEADFGLPHAGNVAVGQVFA